MQTWNRQGGLGVGSMRQGWPLQLQAWLGEGWPPGALQGLQLVCQGEGQTLQEARVPA